MTGSILRREYSYSEVVLFTKISVLDLHRSGFWGELKMIQTKFTKSLLVLGFAVFSVNCVADDIGSQLDSAYSQLRKKERDVPRYELSNQLQIERGGTKMMGRPSPVPALIPVRQAFTPYEKEISITTALNQGWGGSQTAGDLFRVSEKMENDYANEGIRGGSLTSIVSSVTGIDPTDSSASGTALHPGSSESVSSPLDEPLGSDVRAKLDLSKYLTSLQQKRDAQEDKINNEINEQKALYAKAVENKSTNSGNSMMLAPFMGGVGGAAPSDSSASAHPAGSGDTTETPPSASTGDFMKDMTGANTETHPVMPAPGAMGAQASNDYKDLTRAAYQGGSLNRAPASVGPTEARKEPSNVRLNAGQPAVVSALAFADGKKSTAGAGMNGYGGNGATGSPQVGPAKSPENTGDVASLADKADDAYVARLFNQGEGIFGSASVAASASPVVANNSEANGNDLIGTIRNVREELYSSGSLSGCDPKVPPLFCNRPKPCGKDLRGILACYRSPKSGTPTAFDANHPKAFVVANAQGNI